MEKNLISNNHWTIPGLKQRVTTKQLKEILLNNAPPIVRGNLTVLKKKYLGAGVYEIWFESERVN